MTHSRLVTAALLSAALLAPLPGRAAPPAPADLLRYAPADATVILAMDLAALREHPLVRTWLLEHQSRWSGTETDAEAFLRDAGLDPLRDVESMLVAVVPQSGHDLGVAAFGGRFDPTSLAAALVSRGSETVLLGPTTVYRLPAGQQGSHSRPGPLLHASGDVVLIGDERSLSAALAGASGANPLVEQELAGGRLVTDGAFWMVADIPEAVRDAADDSRATDRAPEEIGGVVLASRTVQRVTVNASLDEELVISGNALADTDENAELLRDAIKGALAAARLHAQEGAPELVEVLRDVKVTVDGRLVRGRARVPVELIERYAGDGRDATD